MIFDHINNLEKYNQLHPDFSKIAEFIRNNSLNSMAVGKHEIEGTDCFVLIQQYDTKKAEEAKWESHLKFIDIQYVLSGAERMGCMPVSQLTVSTPYANDKDIMFFNEVEEYVAFEVREDYFSIFLPSDAHKPSCMLGEVTEVRKAVIKVPALSI